MKARYFIFLFSTVLLSQCTQKTADKTANQINIEKDSCCIKKETQVNTQSPLSEITCPNCGHKKTESMPLDVCMIKYTCEKCKTTLFPKEGDCCVFCTYGTHKCPSKQ